MDWMKLVHGEAPAAPAPFRTGDQVRVWFKILEQGKERLGQFEGIVIRCRGSGPSRTFTVRRLTHGEGVERVFPLDAKTIARIEVLQRGRVKRGRLYYLRTVIGKTRIAARDTTAAPAPSATQPPAAKPAHVEAGTSHPATSAPAAASPARPAAR